MVVSISHNGYIKRTPASVYRAQRRGGKGIKGAKTDEDDPIEHLFVASTHDYLLFFTNKGKVYWQKVYDLPQLSRESRGRAVVNLLNLAEGEKIADCRAVRDFDQPDHYLMMATRSGLVKKTALEGLQPAAQERHHRHQAHARTTSWSTSRSPSRATKSCSPPPTAWRSASARPTPARWAATPAASRASSSRQGRPPGRHGRGRSRRHAADRLRQRLRQAHAVRPEQPRGRGRDWPDDEERGATAPRAAEPETPTARTKPKAPRRRFRYRTQRRGGKGLRDIKTTERNGPVIGIVRVDDDDELMMMTARGKIQRVAVSDISVIGRNTQGVRIMILDEGDTLAAIVRVPREEREEEDENGGTDNPLPTE